MPLWSSPVILDLIDRVDAARRMSHAPCPQFDEQLSFGTDEPLRHGHHHLAVRFDESVARVLGLVLTPPFYECCVDPLVHVRRRSACVRRSWRFYQIMWQRLGAKMRGQRASGCAQQLTDAKVL